MVAFTRFAVALTVVSEKEMMVCQLKGTVASLRATGFAHDVVCMTHVDSGMARTHAATLERTCTHVLRMITLSCSFQLLLQASHGCLLLATAALVRYMALPLGRSHHVLFGSCNIATRGCQRWGSTLCADVRVASFSYLAIDLCNVSEHPAQLNADIHVSRNMIAARCGWLRAGCGGGRTARSIAGRHNAAG